MNCRRETVKMAVPPGNRPAIPRDWFRGVPERYVAGADIRGRQAGRPYPWSQQVIHETFGLALVHQQNAEQIRLNRETLKVLKELRDVKIREARELERYLGRRLVVLFANLPLPLQPMTLNPIPLRVARWYLL